jgi:pyruvate kinase
MGPASLGKEREMFEAGATGIRLTFSFGTCALQEERAKAAKAAASQAGKTCHVMADLAGEKFRLGTFQNSPTVPVQAGDTFKLRHGEASNAAEERILAIPEESFFTQITQGTLIAVGDGSALLAVKNVGPSEAAVQVVEGGSIDQKRGLIIQGKTFNPRALMPKDLADLEHITGSPSYDAVALSFVSSPDDVLKVRKMAAQKGRTLPIIAKIETQAGLANLEAICDVSDIVMAARGDLALALPWVELPDAVLRIVEMAKRASIPWIVATQIAEGLQRFTMPTRAEICDLATWMQRGCSGILLSYETAFGANPKAAVRCCAEIMERWSLDDQQPWSAKDASSLLH